MIDTLSKRSLYRIARTVLGQYDLQNAELRLLSTKEHAVFQVDQRFRFGRVVDDRNK